MIWNCIVSGINFVKYISLFPYFADKKTEAQRAQVIYVK